MIPFNGIQVLQRFNLEFNISWTEHRIKISVA